MTEREPPKIRVARREPTLYDAVAGRVTKRGLYQPGRSQEILDPEEALQHSRYAPHIEDYDQHRHLTPEQKLPKSDLLKAIHTYAADFYARNTNDKDKIDERSLDETALIAMGILLEEAAAECLGKTGALALVEPE